MSAASLFNRPDTFLGACEGLGRDLGVHPNVLRLAVALPLLWAPVWSFAAYGAMAVLVLASRLLFPVRGAAAAPAPEAASPEAAAPGAANDGAACGLARAA